MSSSSVLLVNPVSSLVAGITLATLVLFFRTALGKVLGISGFLADSFISLSSSSSSLSSRSASFFKISFILGLLLSGGFLLKSEIPIPTNSPGTLLIGGLLVGAGTKLSGGCTSGHGICGMARLSRRSLISVPLFILSASLTNHFITAADNTFSPPELIFSWSLDARALPLLISAFLLHLIAFLDTKLMKKHSDHFTNVTSFITAFLFGQALTLGGMLNMNHVFGFFRIINFILPQEGRYVNFDPSLLLVLMGALVPNLLLEPFIARNLKAPLILSTFTIPTRKDITVPLVLGSVLFGAGWGVTALCPGPAVVSLSTRPEVAVFIASFFAASSFVHKFIDTKEKIK